MSDLDKAETDIIANLQAERDSNAALRSALIMFMGFVERMSDHLPLSYHECRDGNCYDELCAACVGKKRCERRLDYIAKLIDEATNAAIEWQDGKRMRGALPAQVKLLHGSLEAAQELAKEQFGAADIAHRDLKIETDRADALQKELWKARAILSDALHDEDMRGGRAAWAVRAHEYFGDEKP